MAADDQGLAKGQTLRTILSVSRVLLVALWLGGVGFGSGPAVAQPLPALQTVAPEAFKLAERAGVTAKLLPEGAGLSVATPALGEALLIDLGWLPVEPRTAYQARYRLRPIALTEPANVYLMWREHEARDVRPRQPYPREPVRVREVKPDPQGQWRERELTFVTGEKTRFVSGALVVVALGGELQLGPVSLAVMAPAAPAAPADRAQAQREYEQALAEIRVQAQARVALAPRPLVYSRSQMKYGLERNYYHQWNDRPLLVNRAYRETTPYITSPSSYRRMLEEVAKYDLDGLAFLPETKGRLEMFEVHEQANVPGVGLLPEFLGAYTPEHVRQKGDALERALKSTLSPRLEGKLIITSYDTQSLSPAEWRQTLAALRERVGDRFVFLAALGNVVNLRTQLLRGEFPSRAAIEKEKAYLREYLDVCDGIYFNYPPALRHKDHTFDAAFYREVLIPIFKSVLSEPAYRHKHLGLSAYRAHMSPDRGNNLHEDFTRTLRWSLEAALEARPEVIILPEWDEQNENTSFRPTAYGGTTSQRLLRYYMSRLKSVAPTPVPGDDTSLPNLILSTRKVLTLGEVVTVELLNVPDEATSHRYQVEFAWQDEKGRLVRRFEPVTFDTAKLQEQRFSFPSETIPEVLALVPVLTVRNYKGRELRLENGFHPVQLRATWNWDYLAVRQPLRDLLQPHEVKLAWEPPAGPGSPLVLAGQVKAPQELGLVELLGDDDEVYAVDARGEFFRDDPNHELFLIEYRSLKDTSMKGALTLKHALSPVWLTTGPPLAVVDTKEPVLSQRIELETAVSEHVRWIYFAVPRERLPAAELEFAFDKARFTVALGEVLARRMLARDFAEAIHISVQPYRRQIDLPGHLNQREVSFRVPVWPEIATEQYHLRLTTVKGQVYRSRPLLLPASETPRTPLRVYSETQRGGVDIPVAASRIPVLNYEFDPARGAVLLAGADRPFWAALGGFTSTTTGRGSPNGLFRGSRGQYPAAATRSAPAWVEDEGRFCLEFDGQGNYLELPRETLPARGAYTLSCDLKPLTDQDQCLLVNRVGGSQKGLALHIRNGKLVANFVDKDWQLQVFATGLAAPAGQWSTLRLCYDFTNLTLSLNGASESFPLTLPASNIGFTLIGEGWLNNWFHGRLRNLTITHQASSS